MLQHHYKPAPLIITKHYHFIVYLNENEHPIVLASWTLTNSEQKYTQLEKEALALIF